MRLGMLAEPKLPARIDFPDAIAAGLGVTEYARDGKAAQGNRGPLALDWRAIFSYLRG